ncbi:epoxide hydrolase domain protein [Favolaschia claudopus]|uniref:Epoxide hydrolase domain protein n=1 Tax=Favolaschia claudopus TaxID=2862362 RepID=A0AAV9ZIB1_9AGAR
MFFGGVASLLLFPLTSFILLDTAMAKSSGGSGSGNNNNNNNNEFNLKPFHINLSSQFSHLKTLAKQTQLPEKALYAVGPEKGMQLDVLKDLKNEWVGSYDWVKEEAELNSVKHFTAKVENITVHFVHEKSKNPNAIPVILLHGWPGEYIVSQSILPLDETEFVLIYAGSFHEYLPVVKPLTETSSTGVSYHVVVPSLPGFSFSSPPPLNWTIHDTARIFNTLMTKVLGYERYALHGSDWGSGVGYSMYNSFNTSVRAAHFVFLPFLPPSLAEIKENNITLTEDQKVTVERVEEWNAGDSGYFVVQATKPNDIGLALYDNPVGILAYVGAEVLRWSDPRAGTPPSLLNSTNLLTLVSLYHLTHTFLSSVWIYAQNANALGTTYTKAATDAPMLFTQYKYDVGFWPEVYVEKVGNLVAYNAHDFGGHFPGLDNPPALIEDIRSMAKYFKA